MRIPVFVAALGLFCLPVPAGAVPVAPTGKWVVNFDDAQCIASRAYGAERLFLKASPLGDVVQFGLAQPGRSGPPVQLVAGIRPVSGDEYRGTAVMWSSGGSTPQRLRLINMPNSEFQRLSASAAVTLKIGDLRREFATPDMPQLARVMKTCVDDLQKIWTAGEGGAPATSVATLANYFTSDDYPQEAIRDNLSGTTQFALLIDEQGRVADCMVTQTSGQAGLDMQSCAIVKRRARFTPARDATGKPVKDRVVSRIRWLLP